MKIARKIDDFLGLFFDRAFGGLIAKATYKIVPTAFECFGYQIIQGKGGCDGYPFENVYQYNHFRRLWENKCGEKLPNYDVAKYGGYFSSN